MPPPWGPAAALRGLCFSRSFAHGSHARLSPRGRPGIAAFSGCRNSLFLVLNRARLSPSPDPPLFKACPHPHHSWRGPGFARVLVRLLGACRILSEERKGDRENPFQRGLNSGIVRRNSARHPPPATSPPSPGAVPGGFDINFKIMQFSLPDLWKDREHLQGSLSLPQSCVFVRVNNM